jgi:N-acylglucosamine 2-epimerase
MEKMNLEKITALRKQYEKELRENIIPFWTKYGIDHEYGGFFHYLDRQGALYCSDKGGWFQGRGTWMFAKLYNDVERRREWLDIAAGGVKFMNRHCYDADGRMFFELTRDGRPVRKRRYWFAEAFAAGAMAEYAKASGDGAAMEQAAELFKKIIYYYRNPGALPPKYISENFPIKNHNMRMVLVSVSQILRAAGVPGFDYNAMVDEVVTELFKDFVKPEKKALLECVSPDGSCLDTPIGRRINPGHSMETCWFLLQEGEKRNDRELIRKAAEIIDWSMEWGWDKEYGGIYNYVDLEGRPSDKIEWDMKYWWTHAEALYANLYACYLTGDARFEAHYDKVHEYTFFHFPDYEYGEWYGYLHRDGTLCLDAKGTLFKGPFHIPRSLIYGIKLLERMEKETDK